MCWCYVLRRITYHKQHLHNTQLHNSLHNHLPETFYLTRVFFSSQRFDIDNIARLQNNPIQSGENVQVSFYVNRPSNTADPVVLQSVLASMLVIRESDLESALSQQVQIQTSAAPATPPTATSEQTTNSVVIRISSFDANRVCFRNRRSVGTTRVYFTRGGRKVKILHRNFIYQKIEPIT